MSERFKNILIFVLCFILQVIWFNHMSIGGKYVPLIFIYPLLRLPIQRNEIVSLLIAFIYGLSIDFVSHTGGIFAATAVLITYIRKVYFLTSKNRVRELESFELKNLDFSQKIRYFFIVIFFGQFILYLFESFNFAIIWYKLGTIFINTIISLFFLILIDTLFFQPLKK